MVQISINEGALSSPKGKKKMSFCLAGCTAHNN